MYLCEFYSLVFAVACKKERRRIAPLVVKISPDYLGAFEPSPSGLFTKSLYSFLLFYIYKNLLTLSPNLFNMT